MSESHFVTLIQDLPSGAAREFVIAGRIIAVFHVDGQVYALDGVCPHQGGPLGKGELNGCIVTCPWHQWQFDVQTGESQFTAAVCHETIPVIQDGDRISVVLDSSKGDEAAS
ncbi:MAG: Rieske 2Fe-2S domain-containing protein [Pirellulaceae bacterium]